MFTTENEIIRSSWRQIYRLLESFGRKNFIGTKVIFLGLGGVTTCTANLDHLYRYLVVNGSLKLKNQIEHVYILNCMYNRYLSY